MNVYTKKWNAKYWQTAVLPDITTSAPFDLLVKGTEVTIPTEPTVVFKARLNGEAVVGERLTIAETKVSIDKEGVYAVYLTNEDRELSPLDLGNKYQEAGQKAGQAFVDEAFFTAMVDVAHASNKGATAGVKSGKYNLGTAGAGVALNSSSVVMFLTTIVATLTEQHANEGELWCVIPTWVQLLMINSSLKDAMQMGDDKSVLRTGYMGKLWGMKFFVNTYLTGAGNAATTPTAILAGNKNAIAYTLRMNKTEVYNTGNFEDRIQGIMVYGWKCIKPEGVVNAYAYMASES
jgi:hypothetical protein